MSQLKPDQITRVKGMGFLLNRGTECFSGRILAPGTVFSAKDFAVISQIADTYGNGKLIPTSRQAIEIPGIAYENIDAAIALAAKHGLTFGGTGNKIRPITACKGTTCVYGNFDTQALAAKIHEQYFIGWGNISLPHKFKIAVGGCPNSCIKPSLNDFGIEGHKRPIFDASLCRGCKVCQVEAKCPMKAAKVVDGKLTIDPNTCLSCGVCTGKCPFGAIAKQSETLYQIYIGGTWGKRTRMGTPLSGLVKEEEVLPILEKSMLWFAKYGNPKERFGLAIDRIGIENVQKEILSDELLAQKQELLGI